MLLRNTIYNLIGLGAPLLAALVSIPMLIAALGTDRFGLLILIWAVVSYFGLFDLGLGRALTQQLAVVFAGEEYERVGPLVATASLLMAVLGVISGVLLVTASVWGVDQMRAVPDRDEAVRAAYAMGVAMPFIVLTSGFRGILEAKHSFGVVNAIRLPMGLFTYLGPLVGVMYVGARLDWIAAILSAGRVVACLVHAFFAWRTLPPASRCITFRIDLVKRLTVSGGWLTLSNVISPFMGYVDRFLIGALISSAAVAYYSTPQEIVTKLWIIPGALTTVLFPMFAAQLRSAPAVVRSLYVHAVYWIFFSVLPIAFLLAVFADELLAKWISRDFSNEASVLLQIFSAGIVINCLAHVPLTLLQSDAAFRAPALLHCIELPFYLAILYVLTRRMGLQGAAIGWLARMLLDTAAMFWLARKTCGLSIPWKSLRILLLTSMACIVCFFATTISSNSLKISLATITTFACLTLAFGVLRHSRPNRF